MTFNRNRDATAAVDNKFDIIEVKPSRANYCSAGETEENTIYFNNDFFNMLSLPGPTPTHSIGMLRKSSMNAIYFWQLSGSASKQVIDVIGDCHPGKVM